MVIIIRGNLTLSSLQKNATVQGWRRQALQLLLNAEQTDKLTELELLKGFILLAFDIAVQGPTIQFKKV